MSNRLGSSMTQHAGYFLIFIGLYLCYLFLIALIIRLKSIEPSHSLLHTSRQPKFRPGIGTGQHARLFGVGWFLEWPGGQRPLNSTWPWSGVKLSVLVLWGVCWMFYMRIECWQQAQPYASHNHSLPQPLSRKAPRPLSSHSPPRAKSYLPLGKQHAFLKCLTDKYESSLLGCIISPQAGSHQVRMTSGTFRANTNQPKGELHSTYRTCPR